MNKIESFKVFSNLCMNSTNIRLDDFIIAMGKDDIYFSPTVCKYVYNRIIIDSKSGSPNESGWRKLLARYALKLLEKDMLSFSIEGKYVAMLVLSGKSVFDKCPKQLSSEVLQMIEVVLNMYSEDLIGDVESVIIFPPTTPLATMVTNILFSTTEFVHVMNKLLETTKSTTDNDIQSIQTIDSIIDNVFGSKLSSREESKEMMTNAIFVYNQTEKIFGKTRSFHNLIENKLDDEFIHEYQTNHVLVSTMTDIIEHFKDYIQPDAIKRYLEVIWRSLPSFNYDIFTFIIRNLVDPIINNTLKVPEDLIFEDIEIEEATEAIGGRRRRSLSRNIDNASQKIYRGYKAYKDEEDKVDSQLTKLATSLKNRARGNVQDEILGGKQFSVIRTLKSILGTAAIFSFNKFAGVLYVITKHFYKKKVRVSERREVISTVEAEIKILDEKIEDAKGDNNRQAKYAMMRTRGELEKFLNHMKYGLAADEKSIKTGKAFAAGKKVTPDDNINNKSEED